MMAKEELPECPVATAVALIGGKWKLLIIRNLRVRPWRFNELRRNLEGISQKVLTDSLRQMEDDGLVFRHDYGENPPRVEYGLTELGREMMPIMDSLADFGAYCFVADTLLGGRRTATRVLTKTCPESSCACSMKERKSYENRCIERQPAQGRQYRHHG